MPDYRLLFANMIAPVLLGGACNMAFVRTRCFDSLKKPLDAGLCAADRRPLLGANKTWKGAVGMVALTALWSVLIDSALCTLAAPVPQAPLAPAVLGALLGAVYVIAELPNSYIKRRLCIAPGENGEGWVGGAFVLVDQVDSVLGCLFVAALLTPIRWVDAAVLVVLCGLLHLGVNRALYGLKLKNQRY